MAYIGHAANGAKRALAPVVGTATPSLPSQQSVESHGRGASAEKKHTKQKLINYLQTFVGLPSNYEKTQFLLIPKDGIL